MKGVGILPMYNSVH